MKFKKPAERRSLRALAQGHLPLNSWSPFPAAEGSDRDIWKRNYFYFKIPFGIGKNLSYIDWYINELKIKYIEKVKIPKK